MKEVREAGNKEFLYSMLWALGLLFFGRGVVNSLPQYKVAGIIMTLILFCILAFFVLTRYSARFTYEDTGESLRVNRTIGKRNKEIEFLYRDVLSVYSSGASALPKPRYNMCASVFAKKRRTYIVFGYKGNEQTLIFEPSDDLKRVIAKAVKRSKHK